MAAENAESWLKDEDPISHDETSFDLTRTLSSVCDHELTESDSESENESDEDAPIKIGKTGGNPKSSINLSNATTRKSLHVSRGKNLSLLLQDVSSEDEVGSEDEAESEDEKTDSGDEDEADNKRLIKDRWLNQYELLTDDLTSRTNEQWDSLLDQVRSLGAENNEQRGIISSLKKQIKVLTTKKTRLNQLLKTRASLQKKRIKEIEATLQQLKVSRDSQEEENEKLRIEILVLQSANTCFSEDNITKNKTILELEENLASIQDTLCIALSSQGLLDEALTEDAFQELLGLLPEIELENIGEIIQITDSTNEISIPAAPEPKAAAPADVKRDLEKISDYKITSTEEPPLKKVKIQKVKTQKVKTQKLKTQKVKTQKKTQLRKVQNGYFRWPKEKNIELLTAMIEILKQHGEFFLIKEEDLHTEAWEHCKRMIPLEKIRDNMNNLIRRYARNFKDNIKEAKANTKKYIALLERIRDFIENEQEKSPTI